MTGVRKGDRISEYVLDEPLGRGGFGEVWKAHHYELEEREVAIKIPVSPEAVRDLTKEGVLRAGLDHPGIAKTLGMDVTADPPYFVTEFVPGSNLRDIMNSDGPLLPSRARRILLDVLDILGYAHERGIVHQDIKPENILVTDDGEVKLTDFGLGHTITGDSLLLSASLRSEAQPFGGTLAYMAPEVRDMSGSIDGRADLYSLGIVLFELLTGKRPAGRELPSDLEPGLPVWCDRVFAGLYTRRDRRYSDVSAVECDIAKEFKAATVTPLTPPKRRFATEAEARRILGFTSKELEHWMRRGNLEAFTINGERRFDRDQIHQFNGDRPRVEQGSKPTRLLSGKSARRVESVADRVARVSEALASKPRDLDSRALRTRRPVGFWIRALAMLIDLWFVGVLQAVVTAPLFFFPVFFGPQFALLSLAYFGICTGLYGQTLGKLALGVEVIRVDGREMTLLDGFVRTVNYLLSLLPFGLGFMVAGWNQRRLAVHDLVCSTQVVRVQPSGARASVVPNSRF